jgi:LysM domain
MTAMTVLSIGDDGEPLPVRPLTAVPDLDVPACRNVPAEPARGGRRARRPGETGPAAAAVMPPATVLPSRIIAPRPPGARHAGARSASPGPVRLTRRGRVVVGGLAIAAVVAIAFLLSLTLAGGAQASSHGAAGAGYHGMRRMVVEPGQTLWSIASAAQPAADPRLVIQQITTANSLSGASIYAGEQLWVPSR